MYFLKIKLRHSQKKAMLYSVMIISSNAYMDVPINYCVISLFLCVPSRDGNGAGRGRRMGSSSPPHMVLSCPIPVLPRMTGNIFSPHPRPLGPREASPCPIKLYFLLICPTTSTIFFMKLISLIKIYLKLKIYPIKSNQFLEKIE